MLKVEPDSAPQRWIFGRYVVLAANRFDARRIYELAFNRADQGTRFGRMDLDGATGTWVLLPDRPQAQGTS